VAANVAAISQLVIYLKKMREAKSRCALTSMGTVLDELEAFMNDRDLSRLQGRLGDLDSRLAGLRIKKELQELLLIIKRPGWTTPAELAFAISQTEATLALANLLADTMQGLLKGSRAVSTK
jgi:hypothetical protein